MEDTLEKIWDYLDGNLSHEERLQVEILQKSDAEFNLLFKSQLQLHRGLSKSVVKPAPLNFADQIMAKLATTNSLVPSNSFNGFKYIMIGLAFILMLFSVSAFLMPMETTSANTLMPSELVAFKSYFANIFSSIQFIKITPYWSVFFAVLVLFWADRLLFSAVRLNIQRH